MTVWDQGVEHGTASRHGLGHVVAGASMGGAQGQWSFVDRFFIRKLKILSLRQVTWYINHQSSSNLGELIDFSQQRELNMRFGEQ